MRLFTRMQHFAVMHYDVLHW